MKHTPSLFGHLLAWTLGALFVVWMAFMYFGYSTGVHEAEELTDGHLASVASVLFSQPGAELGPRALVPKTGSRAELKAHDYQQSMSIVVWNAQGEVLSRSGSAPTPPFHAEEGFETIQLGTPPKPWRVFSRWDGSEHGRKISVMLSEEESDELAEDIAAQIAEPGLWLLPVVALVLIFALRRGLRPLRELSEQVNQLDVHRDTTLQAPPAHEEFQAIVTSIDTLIGCYNTVLSRERQLASEVAHELRTPLASLRLHASSLQHALTPEELAATRQQIAVDAERAGAVLTDLLALARASRAELAETQEPIDLSDLARRVAAEFGQAALESDHELSVEAPDACPLSGHRVILELALRNLIENALAHTPRGSTVRVQVKNEPLTLAVIDNGATRGLDCGPAPARRHLGLGLGHQVVRRVADIHNGHFESVDLRASGERCYRIVFTPAAPAVQAAAKTH